MITPLLVSAADKSPGHANTFVNIDTTTWVVFVMLPCAVLGGVISLVKGRDPLAGLLIGGGLNIAGVLGLMLLPSHRKDPANVRA